MVAQEPLHRGEEPFAAVARGHAPYGGQPLHLRGERVGQRPDRGAAAQLPRRHRIAQQRADHRAVAVEEDQPELRRLRRTHRDAEPLPGNLHPRRLRDSRPPPEEPPQTPPQRPRRREHLPRKRLVRLAAEFRRQVLLRGKMHVERPLGHPGRARDRLDGRPREAAAPHERAARVDDFPARFERRLLPMGHGRSFLPRHFPISPTESQ